MVEATGITGRTLAALETFPPFPPHRGITAVQEGLAEVLLSTVEVEAGLRAQVQVQPATLLEALGRAPLLPACKAFTPAEEEAGTSSRMAAAEELAVEAEGVEAATAALVPLTPAAEEEEPAVEEDQEEAERAVRGSLSFATHWSLPHDCRLF